MLGKSCTSAPPDSAAKFGQVPDLRWKRKILCWENRAPVLPQIDQQIFHKSQIWGKLKGRVLASMQELCLFYLASSIVKKRQKMTRNDKNCTVGRKIELWSHCAPPKIVKNRQKMTKIAQWDGKLNFGPTVHRQKLSKSDKNCTVGRKIELWSHCAPAKSHIVVAVIASSSSSSSQPASVCCGAVSHLAAWFLVITT